MNPFPTPLYVPNQTVFVVSGKRLICATVQYATLTHDAPSKPRWVYHLAGWASDWHEDDLYNVHQHLALQTRWEKAMES